MALVNIVGRYNSAGVENDIKILGSILSELGHQVTYSEASEKTLFFRLHKKILFDVNLFVEQVEPLLLPAARKNILKPNQESRFKEEGLDAIFAKTRYAESLFTAKGLKTHYMGFCSLDRYRPGIAKEPFVLHTTSRSTLKGTAEVIETWRRYSDLPKLVVLIAPIFRHLIISLPHVEWIDTFLPEEELVLLQNRALCHLCPSVTEGFGHSICEALSTGALVITTDAPPMNELVTEERGLLCPWSNQLPAGYGDAFYCKPEQIRESVLRAFALDNKAERQERARHFFEQLRPALKERLRGLLETVVLV